MTSQKRNIWVLGASGYIGSALLRHLSKDAGNRLHLLLHKRMPLHMMESYSAFSGSLSGFDPLWMERYPPDVIFHLARPAGGNKLTRQIAAYKGERVNRRVANILSRLANPPVVVYVSGSLVYGNRFSSSPAAEDSDPAPTAYARWYYRNEIPWLEARRKGLLDVRFARPGWIIGPASWFRAFFWMHYLETGKVPCYGDGKQLMSLIHVDDGVALMDALSRQGKPGQDLNIFSGQPITHHTFVEILAGLLGAEVEVLPASAVRRKFGHTTAEALLSSIPMTTLHRQLYENNTPQYRNPQTILSDIVRLLKNEQGVLAKTP